jgi:peptidoglycan-associated lipoprotein
MRKGWLIVVLAVACVTLTGCRRSGGEVWQDTKTCGKQVKLGFLSLFGKRPAGEGHGPSRAEFAGADEGDFIPLHDEDLYGKIVMNEIDADTAIPQSGLLLGRDLPGIEGFMEPSGELARIFQRIHFDTDDYTVRGDNNLRCAKEIAAYMNKHRNTYVFIEGHCDERGAASYNLALGARRSNSVRNYLIKQGVDLNRLFTVSYGKEKPLTKGHGATDWRENRRAQFRVHERTS